MTIIMPRRRLRRPGNEAPHGPFTLNRDSPQAQGLVAWWPFIGFPFIRQKDLSSYAFDIDTVDGAPTISVNRFGGHNLEVLRASSQAVGLSTIPVGVDSDGPLSFTAWYRPDSRAVHNSWVSIQRAASAASRDAIGFHTGSGVQHYLATSTGQANSNQGSLTQASVDAGAWHFSGCSAVVNVSGLTADFYHRVQELRINDWATISSTTGINNFDQVYIGRGRYSSEPEYAGGGVFDVRIWNRAIGRDLIEQVYDPSTRWDLYYELGRQYYFFPSSAGGIINEETVAAIATAVPVFGPVKILKSLSVSALTLPVLGPNSILKTHAAIALGTPIINRNVLKTLAVTATGTPTLDPIKLATVVLAAIATGIVTLAKMPGLGVSATASSAASIGRLIFKTLERAASAIAALVVDEVEDAVTTTLKICVIYNVEQ